jgi:hypothetical protein
MRLSGFHGLDVRPSREAGSLAKAESIDPRCFPSFVTMRMPAQRLQGGAGETLALQKIGKSLFRVYLSYTNLYLERHGEDGRSGRVSLPSKDTVTPRTLLAFHEYTDPADPLSGSYRQLGILLPDCLVFDPEAETLSLSPLAGEGGMPALTYGCVHLSRLFGAAGDRLYASAYNDPRSFQLDTAEDIDPTNAWAAAVQSNTQGTGAFTAMTVFGGQVLAFKQSFCHVLNNNKNPFRVADLMPYGTRDGRTLAEVDGKLYFVSDEGVCRYNGESVSVISRPLGEIDLTDARAAGGAGLYWLYLPSLRQLLVYSEQTRSWSALSLFAPAVITGMCSSEDGCYLVDRNGSIYLAEKGIYGEFSATTGSLLQESLGRAVRLELSLTAAEGADVLVLYTDTSERTVTLLHHMGTGRAQRVRSRVFTPADYGGSLQIYGFGEVTVHELLLLVAESGER